MAVDGDGALEWEWDPISLSDVFERLQADGHFVVDIWPLINEADREYRPQRSGRTDSG